MKANFLISTTLIFSLIFLFSCKKDEPNIAPEISEIEISADNQTVTVTFSEPVYANSDATGNLEVSDLLIGVKSTETVNASYTLVHTAGDKTAVITVTFESFITGTETLIVKPADDASIYDTDGMAMSESHEKESGNLNADEETIVATWLSEGDNVAPLLSAYFETTKIIADFKADGTYEVQEWRADNTSDTPDLIYTGEYSAATTDSGDIMTIELTQSTPYEAEVAGIYELKADKSTKILWYEVVQTSGTQNTPPTPEAGFGSSNEGAFANTNVQKFVRQ